MTGSFFARDYFQQVLTQRCWKIMVFNHFVLEAQAILEFLKVSHGALIVFKSRRANKISTFKLASLYFKGVTNTSD
jgi:hypothetical protein